jgi:hypothetical protein
MIPNKNCHNSGLEKIKKKMTKGSAKDPVDKNGPINGFKQNNLTLLNTVANCHHSRLTAN